MESNKNQTILINHPIGQPVPTALSGVIRCLQGFLEVKLNPSKTISRPEIVANG
jgi:hypothetical protein